MASARRAEPARQAGPAPGIGIGWIVLVAVSVVTGVASTRGEWFDLLRPHLMPAAVLDKPDRPLELPLKERSHTYPPREVARP